MKKPVTSLLISYFSLTLTFLLGIYIIYHSFSCKNQLVYFDSHEVFEKFSMSRELYSKGNKEITLRQNRIDSLYLHLNNPNHTIPKDSLTKLLIMENESLKEFNENFSSKESLKIWARINTYAKEFAKQHDYKLIIGTQNASTMMYGKKENNITQEFLAYINNKYEGKK